MKKTKKSFLCFGKKKTLPKHPTDSILRIKKFAKRKKPPQDFELKELITRAADIRASIDSIDFFHVISKEGTAEIVTFYLEAATEQLMNERSYMGSRQTIIPIMNSWHRALIARTASFINNRTLSNLKNIEDHFEPCSTTSEKDIKHKKAEFSSLFRSLYFVCKSILELEQALKHPGVLRTLDENKGKLHVATDAAKILDNRRKELNVIVKVLFNISDSPLLISSIERSILQVVAERNRAIIAEAHAHFCKHHKRVPPPPPVKEVPGEVKDEKTVSKNTIEVGPVLGIGSLLVVAFITWAATVTFVCHM